MFSRVNCILHCVYTILHCSLAEAWFCSPMNLIIRIGSKMAGNPVPNLVHALCRQFVDGQGELVGDVCLRMEVCACFVHP